MRITLDIDDELLQAVKDLARREKKTLSQVISQLARKALGAAPPDLHGFRPLPGRGGIVTNELIDKLREHGVH